MLRKYKVLIIDVYTNVQWCSRAEFEHLDVFKVVMCCHHKGFLKMKVSNWFILTSPTAVRKEFEQSFGRKVNSAEKAELKSAAIAAVTASDNNGTDTPKTAADAKPATQQGRTPPNTYRPNHASPCSASTPGSAAGHAATPNSTKTSHTPMNKFKKKTPPSSGGCFSSSSSHTWEQSQISLPMSQRKRPRYEDGKPTAGTIPVAKAPRILSGPNEKKSPILQSSYAAYVNGKYTL